MKGLRIVVRSAKSVLDTHEGFETTHSGRWCTGDLNGPGDVGDSEYGEKADISDRSGEGSIGDFNAIIIVEKPKRSEAASESELGINCRTASLVIELEDAAEVNNRANSDNMRGSSMYAFSPAIDA